jgi:pyruvate dehydrogenase E2 component (dihydrolipoamide acetyltransferase)
VVATLTEVVVPDLGDFKDVPIIEILVKPGDRVSAEDPLITLESDKATMDVPAPVAGVVKELIVKVGDKVSQGSRVLMLEATATDESGTPATTAAASVSGAAPPAPLRSVPRIPSPSPAAPAASAPSATAAMPVASAMRAPRCAASRVS